MFTGTVFYGILYYGVLLGTKEEKNMAYKIENRNHVFVSNDGKQRKQRTMEEVEQLIDKNFPSEELKDAAKKIVDIYSRAGNLHRYYIMAMDSFLVTIISDNTN